MNKRPPLILHSPLTDSFYIVTRYTVKKDHVLARTKYDCTDRIKEIVAREISIHRQGMVTTEMVKTAFTDWVTQANQHLRAGIGEMCGQVSAVAIDADQAWANVEARLHLQGLQGSELHGPLGQEPD